MINYTCIDCGAPCGTAYRCSPCASARVPLPRGMYYCEGCREVRSLPPDQFPCLLCRELAATNITETERMMSGEELAKWAGTSGANVTRSVQAGRLTPSVQVGNAKGFHESSADVQAFMKRYGPKPMSEKKGKGL